MSEVAHCHRCDILDLAPGTTECFGCEQPPLRDTTCETCAGIGYHERENWHENEVQDCPDCGGTGRREGRVVTMTEAQIQRGLTDALRTLGYQCYHTEFAIRSDKGFPDIVAVNQYGSIVALECKGPRGRLRPEQTEWINRFSRNGDCFLAAVVGPTETDRWISYDQALTLLTREIPDMTTPESTEPRAASGGV